MNIDPHRLHAPDIDIWIGEAPMTEAATLLRKSLLHCYIAGEIKLASYSDVKRTC